MPGVSERAHEGRSAGRGGKPLGSFFALDLACLERERTQHQCRKEGGHVVFNNDLTFTIASYPSLRIVKFGVRSTTAVDAGELMKVMLLLGRRSVRRSAAACHAAIGSSRCPAPALAACFSSSGRDSRQLPRVVSEQTLFENPWIRLKRILFLDAKGSERHWTGLERTTTYPKTSPDAVAGGSAEPLSVDKQDKQEVCDAVVVFPFLTKQGPYARRLDPPVPTASGSVGAGAACGAYRLT